MNNVRVLLLEDSSAVAIRIEQIIAEWEQAELVGSCSTLQEALSALKESSIDLLIADLKLPDGHGSEAIHFLRQQQPNAQSIVLSALSDRNTVVKAIQAGAAGYILKDDDQLEIVQSCQEILDGKSPMSTSIARQIIEILQSNNFTSPHADIKESPLTSRETEVLSVISKGYSYRETAKLLDVSEQTIPVHIRNIYRKLEVKNRTSAVFEARKSGLID